MPHHFRRLAAAQFAMSLAWDGVVLAGGESRRMGRDKATLTLDGELLWRRQIRVLREAGAASVAIVRAPDQPALANDVPHLRDQIRDVGPLAGLHAALAAPGASLVAVLAVDLPRIDASWFNTLLSYCTETTGAIVQHAGRFEPLAAFYPRAALPQLEHLLAQRNHRLQSLAALLVAAQMIAPVTLPSEALTALANWNFPSDLPASAR
jgi:molybdopterin-guanine dinucleotide biosynthesis protein A